MATIPIAKQRIDTYAAKDTPVYRTLQLGNAEQRVIAADLRTGRCIMPITDAYSKTRSRPSFKLSKT